MIQGLCYICGKPAVHVCSVCGSAVCDEHYAANLRACTKCASKGRDRKREVPDELTPETFRV